MSMTIPFPFVLGNINVKVVSLPRTSEELNSEVRS